MRLARSVVSLPATVPFVAPEALERSRGRGFELRLGANESPFGPAPAAVEAMAAAAAQAAFYGDPESWELRQALAKLQQRPANEFAVGCGIDGLLGLLVRAVMDPGEVAVVSLGSYPTFAYHVEGFGGRLERVPYRRFANDLDALLDAAKFHEAKLVYLANPDNPTGSWLEPTEIERFVKRLPGECLLVLDEAYAEFCPAPLPEPNPDQCVRFRTFSKAYGMAGARIGYAMGPLWLIQSFDRIRNHFEVNRIAQAGALASLPETEWLRSVVAEVEAGREEMTRTARDLGLEVLPSGTNFVSLQMRDAEESTRLVQSLDARDIFVRRPSIAPLDTLVRFTLGTPTQRGRLEQALRDSR